MGRRLRIDPGGIVCHIINRRVGHETIFSDPGDYAAFEKAPQFDARTVHRLRNRLGLSQGLFARLLGVSRKLIEAWEAGTRTPSPMACRLLDSICRDPTPYVRRRVA